MSSGGDGVISRRTGYKTFDGVTGGKPELFILIQVIPRPRLMVIEMGVI